jgi:hypothetical protein
MFERPKPLIAAEPAADEALRTEVAALRARLATVEALLTGLYGANALGGPRPVAPEPEPERRLRPIGTLPGGGTIMVSSS